MIDHVEYTNPDLKNKYKDNASFRELMDFNKKKYDQKLQQSLYSDLSKVNKKMLQIMTHDVDIKNLNGSKIYADKRQVLYVYSHFQSEQREQLHKFYLYFITTFPEPRQSFQLVYVNSSQTGKGKGWSTFKNSILEELPLKYLLFLQKIVLIRPSLLDKASSIVQFGVQNKFFKEKLQKFDTLKSYFQTIGVKFVQMRKQMPEQVIKDEFMQDIVRPFFESSLICKLNDNRTSYDVAPQIQKSEILKLTTIPSKQKPKKKGLQNYPTGQLGIPLALELMIFYFTQVPVRCQAQGIFRKCTSIDDQRQLVRQLQLQNYQILTQIENDIAVGSAIKRFITGLQPPIIPYHNYQLLVKDHSLQSIIQQVHTFPIINYMTLMHLIKFLREYIIPQQKKNLMTADNISICFAPVLMRSQHITQRQFMLATINIDIAKILITRFEEIFGDRQQQRRISRRTYKIFRRNSKKSQEDIQFQQNLKQHEQLKQNVTDNHQGQQFIRAPTFSCPEDFLKPVTTIIQSQRESQSERGSLIQSERTSQNIEQTPQSKYRVSFNYGKTNQLEIPVEPQKSEMKKHRSWKRLPCFKESAVDVKEYARKSACDKDEIANEDQIGIPSLEDEAQRLNKLRINRSRLG